MKPNIESILERQAKLWQRRKRLAEQGGEAARDALVHLGRGPWVALSRSYGSAGIEIAEALARELDWQLYDHEIVQRIAERTATREAVLKPFDEHAISGFHDYLRKLMVPSVPDASDYTFQMTSLVWGIASRGKAVIVGRGANWFLDAAYGLRVRVVGSLERRVERVAGKQGVPAARAREEIRRHDDQRAGFVRQVFGQSIDDPLGYDLVINTDHLTVEGAVDVSVTALRRKLHAA